MNAVIYIIRCWFGMVRIIFQLEWLIILLVAVLMYRSKKWKCMQANRSFFLHSMLIILAMSLIGGYYSASWYPSLKISADATSPSVLPAAVHIGKAILTLMLVVGISVSCAQVFVFKMDRATLGLLSIAQCLMLAIASLCVGMAVTNQWL